MEINLEFNEIVSIFALLISIAGTILIPWQKNKRKQKRLERELDNYKDMLEREYIKEFNDTIDYHHTRKSYELYAKDTTSDEYYETIRDFKDKCNDKAVRLEYKLEEELTHLSSENQFKMVRMTQFTLMYFSTCLIILDVVPKKT